MESTISFGQCCFRNKKLSLFNGYPNTPNMSLKKLKLAVRHKQTNKQKTLNSDLDVLLVSQWLKHQTLAGKIMVLIPVED